MKTILASCRADQLPADVLSLCIDEPKNLKHMYAPSMDFARFHCDDSRLLDVRVGLILECIRHQFLDTPPDIAESIENQRIKPVSK